MGGVDFSPAADIAAQRLSLAEITEPQLIGKPVQLAFLDLKLIESTDLRVKFRSVFRRKGHVHGLAGWFTAYLGEGITLSTAPTQPLTHWKQAWLPISESVAVDHGEYVDVTLHIRSHPDQERQADGALIQYTWEFAEAQVGIDVRWTMDCPCESGKTLSMCCG